MNQHLQDIRNQIARGSHAVVVLDGAGWHKSRNSAIPDSLSLLFLPPYNPKLNEYMLEFLTFSQLANRVFQTVEDVKLAIRKTWLDFVGDPVRTHSITYREWAILQAGANTNSPTVI